MHLLAKKCALYLTAYNEEQEVQNQHKRNKKGIVLGCVVSAAVIGVTGAFLCAERIPAGYVGVQYSVNGGVKDDVLSQGWHIVSPTVKVTKYSVATEQLYMSSDAREGFKENDSFDVICKDGKMNIDLEMSYSFDPDNVTKVFEKYRGMNGDTVVNTIVRGKIKTKVSEVTSKYTVLDAYMEKKPELNADITNALREYLKEFGITVESANITRATVDNTIEASITERSRVAQELEVEKMNQEKARLQAETALIEADGKNKVMIQNAQAEAEAYKIKSEQITDDLLQKWLIDKWDGKLPVMSGSSDIMLDVNEMLK